MLYGSTKRLQLSEAGDPKRLMIAFAINGIALAITCILTVLDILPSNYVLSPLYIFVCSLTHRLFVKLQLPHLLIVQAATFAAFPFINFGIAVAIVRSATI